MGTATNGEWEAFMTISQSLSEIAKMSFTFVDKTKIPYCNRLSKVENDLWCAETGTSKIHIFSNYAMQKRTVELENINIYNLIQVRSKIVIASKQGIYLTNINGLDSQKIANGEYCDASAHGDHLFALNNNEGKICILEHINDQKNI